MQYRLVTAVYLNYTLLDFEVFYVYNWMVRLLQLPKWTAV